MGLGQWLKGRRLVKAATQGDLDLVETLIKTGVDVDCRYLGNTPLFSACRSGHYEIIKLLLQNKADPNSRNSLNFQPIQGVIDFLYNGERYLGIRILRLLLESGANPAVQIPGDEDWSASKWVAHKKDDWTVAKLLVDYGARTDSIIDEELIKRGSSIEAELDRVDLACTKPAKHQFLEKGESAGPCYYFLQMQSNVPNEEWDRVTYGLGWMPMQENAVIAEGGHERPETITEAMIDYLVDKSLITVTTPALCVFTQEESAQEFIVQSRNIVLGGSLPTGVVELNPLMADIEYIKKIARSFYLKKVVVNPVYGSENAKSSGVVGDRIVNIDDLS